MRYGRASDGIIDGAALFEDSAEGRELAVETGFPIALGETGGIGWLWDGKTLSPPPPLDPHPVPDAVTPAQAKTALYNAGLYDRAEAAVGNSQYALIRIWWNSAQEWKRSDPYIYAIAVELGLDDDAVDDLFRAAGRVAR